MAKAEFDDSAKLALGQGERDLQEDIIDSQQTMGLDAEERSLAEQAQLEQLDVLEGLRQMQTADPITWKVYRAGHEESKYNGYLGQLQTTSLTQEYLRKKFGGGQYRVRGTFSGGRYAAQRQLTIAGESILYIPTEMNGATPTMPSAGPAFNMSEFLTVQQNMDEKRRDADERRRQQDDERSERRSKETRDFIVALGAVVAPVVTALVSKAAAPVVPAPALDLAGLAAILKPSGESPMSSMKGMLEMMGMMRDLMPGGGDSGSDTAEIIKAVSAVAAPALQAFANRPTVAATVRPRLARPDPSQTPTRPAPIPVEARVVPPTVAPPPTPFPGETPTIMQSAGPDNGGVDLSAPSVPLTPGQQTMFAQLKPQVDTLVGMAREGQDAKAVGDMFYDQFLASTNDEMYDQLCDLFEDPKTIDRIALFNAGVKEFRPWFVTLQETIIAKIKLEAAQAVTQNTEVVDSEPGAE